MARVAIIEDDRALADQMVWALQHADHEALVAYDGAQALALLGLEPPDAAAPLPDVIVLDVMMPSVNGVEVCRRLAAEARAAKVPVIIASGRGEARGAFRALANVRAFLDKPFDGKKLLAAVDGALRAPR